MKPVTIITGTSRGIGKFLAEHYVAKGHHVIGCSRQSVDWNLDGYVHVVADVADEPGVKSCSPRFGRITVDSTT